MRDGAPTRAIERCVGDVATFAREVWNQRSGHYPQADPDAYADVLSLDDVDALVGPGGLRHPALRIVREGQALPPSSYLTSHTTGGKRVTDAIDPDRVATAFREGATVVLQGLHRLVPSVQKFCDELESFLGHPVQANAYLTPAGSRGLAVHHDTHDVLVLQLHGLKRWSLYEPTIPHPIPSFPRAKRYDDPGEPCEVLDLEPGDCLYLPRGLPHEAEGRDTSSLHLTVGIRSPTWLDVIERTMKRASELPALRAPLPLRYAGDEAALASGVREALTTTADWLRGIDPRERAAEEVESARRARAPRQVGRLAGLAEETTIADHTRFRPASEVPWRADITDGHAVLQAGRHTLRMPARVLPALHQIVSADTVAARDLTDHLTPPSALVLIRRLHREGLLRPVEDE